MRLEIQAPLNITPHDSHEQLYTSVYHPRESMIAVDMLPFPDILG
jgi:hypothetical protein